MARMTAAQAAVEILKAGGSHPRLRAARCRDQPVLQGDEDATAACTTRWPGTSRAPRTWPRATPGPRPATSASASAPAGPAGTDMITGLYSATADSIPILCITGQAPVAKLHKEDFQAVDIAAIAKPLTKMAVTVLEPAQVPGHVPAGVPPDAFRAARARC